MSNKSKIINGYYAGFKNKNSFMPFGSLMNAYGQTMKPKNIEEFLKDSEKIYEIAKEMTGKLYIETAEEIEVNQDTPKPAVKLDFEQNPEQK